MVPRLLDLVIDSSSGYLDFYKIYIVCLWYYLFLSFDAYLSSSHKTLTPAKIELRNRPQGCIQNVRQVFCIIGYWNGSQV